MPLNDTLLDEDDPVETESRELVRQQTLRQRSGSTRAQIRSPRARFLDLSSEDELHLKELANSARPMQSAPAEQTKPEKPLGLMGTIREGAKGTLRALGATADTMQGDAQGVVTAAQEQAAAPKDPDLERFYAHIEERKAALGDNPSLWEGIKAVGGAAIDNPRGFGLMVAEQLPNSGAALGAAGAGALAGSFGGPVGATIGGLAGLAAANIGLETGHKALEAAGDNAFTPDEQSRVRREGLTKGAIITGVDALTLGATKFITNTTRRAVERATIKTLADNGIDVTSAAARRAAMETPEIAEAVKSAQTLAKDGASKLGTRLAQTGGAVALETIGEGAGEYLGELAATGKANAVDAVIEGFAGLGTSIGEIAATSALNRKGLQRLLDSPEEAESTAKAETEKTGVEHESIQHPTEPDKFVAVPKVRSVSGIELERDAEGNLKPVATVSTQADFNLANKPGFELTAEDKIRERELSAARSPIIVPDAAPMGPVIAGRPASSMTNSALVYTVERGGKRAQEIATNELKKRESQGVDLATDHAPETPVDTVTRIVATGAEKAQEEAKKIIVPTTTPKVAKPATAPKVTPAGVPEAKKAVTPSAAPKAESKVTPRIDSVTKPASKTNPVASIQKEQQSSSPPALPKTDAAPQSTATRRFDHGELNIKGRTNNIDRELDKYKKEQATLAKTKTKATAQQTKEHKALAKSLLSQFGNEIVEKHKDKFGEKELKRTLDQWSKWEPHKLISFVDKFIQEKAAAPASKAETAKLEPTKPEPAPETPPLRAHIADLIKRRAAASQTGKDRTVNNAIARAKEVMDGKRTDTALESKWFHAHAATMRKTDPATADILSRISEAIKTNEKTEKAVKTESPNVAVRGDSRPVFQARGGRILANGIAESIQKNGVAALVGQKITSPERLAELAQIYRNPQYETFRIFFTKGNVIIHASGVTARLPGQTPIFPKDMNARQGVEWIKEMMRSSGADGYWMLHNHPSGNPTPSNADVDVTGKLAQWAPGLKGHVVINSNRYSQIVPGAKGVKTKVTTKHFAEDVLLKASKPHEYIGKQISRPLDAAAIGKSFQKEGWVTLIGISGVSGVRAIAEIPTNTFTTPGLAKAAIRRFARKTGSGAIFAYGTAADLKAGNATELTREGFLRDAVDEAGKAYGVSSNGKTFGREPGDGGVQARQSDGSLVLNEDQASPLRTRIDKITDSLIFNFQDRFKPLKDIQKRTGPVTEDEDASLAEERYSGMVRARMDTFEEQMRDPLLKAIHDSNVSYENVEKYLHALHAPSRNAAMREINPTESELKAQTDSLEKQRDSLAKDADVQRFIKERRDLRQAEADIEDGIADESLARMIKNELAQLRRVQNVKDYTEALDKLKALRLVKPFEGDNTALSGMSDAEAKAILAKADKDGTRKALDAVSALVDTITSRTRQIYVESGLEKADAIDAWNNKYEHYVPLHRDEVSGNTMPKVGQGFNIRGKESKRATGSTKDVTNILAHVVAQHEAAIIRSEKARVDRALFQFASTHPDPSLWTLDTAPMIRMPDPVTGFVVERVDPTFKNRPEVLTLKIDGEEHTITFEESNQEAMRLAASMKNMTSQEMGEVTQMVGKFTRFLATMNTTANPVFVARNFLRDLQTAFVNLSDTAIAEKKREVFRNVPAAIKGMWNLSRGKHNSQWAKYAEEFKAAGGQTGWMEHYNNIGERADTLKQELALMGPGKLNATRRSLNSWWHIVQDANNAVENGARLSAYVAARKAGLSEGKAAQLAKNLTVNFNTRGAKSVELNAWYMFMNASIQGNARLIKAMSNRQVRKIVAGVVLSGFLMDIMARSMAGDDDEDGENDYDQLPEHTKAMNFVLMVDGQPVTIPMPYGYNFFASAGRKVSEMIFRENYSPVKSATDLAGIFLDAFSPTGQAGSGLQFAAPTVADPFIQWAENKNFAGNPLRREQTPFGVPKPEHQMGFKSTSAPAKWLAEALNDTTGGNEVRPGFINVNPAFFDFAVSSILGGMGRTYMQTVSGPVKLASGDDLQAREIPFANIFVGARPEHQTERKYFEAVKAVELAQKELKTYREKGDAEMVRQIREEHKEELRLAQAAKTTKNILSQLRKRDLALDKTDPPNKRELRREIEEKKREAMARFNKRYREAVAAE